MTRSENRQKRSGEKQIPYEKAVTHLCRKLQLWHETVLAGSPDYDAGKLTECCIITASLFVLREKKLIADHKFFSSKGQENIRRTYSDLFRSLPSPIRKLDIFNRSFPEIRTDHWTDLSAILSGSVRDLVRRDPCAEWLGRLFEILLSSEKQNDSTVSSSRKKTGSFYTPRPVVSHMVREALIRYFSTEAEKRLLSVNKESFRDWICKTTADGSDLQDLVPYRTELLDLLKGCRLLDPSCGSGFFLLEALRILTDLWESLEKRDPHCQEKIQCSRKGFILQNVLYGMDIQLFPLQIAQFCFFLDLSVSRPVSLPEKIHLYCCNAVLSPPDQTKEFFDIVIGNPPYVSIPAIPPDERIKYRKTCSFARGRFNLFYLFLEKSQFWMKKNSCCIFLVPDRVILNTQCGTLRDFLLKRMDLFQWISFEKPLFQSASVDPVILGYCNRSASATAEKRILCRKNIRMEDLDSRGYQHLSPRELCSSSRTGAEEKICTLAEKIRQKSSLVLGDAVTIRDGIIQGTIGEHLFLQKDPKLTGSLPADCHKLLFGRDITPYRIRFQENYVHYNIPLMKELERKSSPGRSSGLRMRKREIFLAPKILSRQTADRIIASLDEKGEYFYANTLHGSTIIPYSGYDLYFVLGFMNSDLATFLYRSQSMEQGKNFAQIKIALLKNLPMPAMEKKMQRKISSLVREILKVPPLESGNKTEQLQTQINRLIYTFYDLTPDEILLAESIGHTGNQS